MPLVNKIALAAAVVVLIIPFIFIKLAKNAENEGSKKK